MSMYFGPVTVTVGALAPIITTQFPNANVAVMINESPYTLKVDPGTGSYFVISAFTQDAVPLGNQFSGVLKVTASADITFAGTAPASVLYVQVYAKGEPLPGTYPSALARQVNVGGGTLTAATQVIQTAQVAPTPVLEATPSAQFTGAALDAVINNDGSASFGTGPGGINQNKKVAWDTAGNENVWSLTENGGGIASTAAVTLQHGNQATTIGGGNLDNGVAGHVVGLAVSFPVQLTNAPTSITLTTLQSFNESGPGADTFEVYGFRLQWSVAANGLTTYVAKCVTVGN